MQYSSLKCDKMLDETPMEKYHNFFALADGSVDGHIDHRCRLGTLSHILMAHEGATCVKQLWCGTLNCHLSDRDESHPEFGHLNVIMSLFSVMSTVSQQPP